MSQSILTRLDCQVPKNTSSQAGGHFPPVPPQVALCLAGVVETETPVFHSPNRTDGHAVMETASRFPYGPQPAHSLGEIWQKRNRKALAHGTEMYISKDNFSYASTRYCKSSGSASHHLSAPFSGPTGQLLVTSDSSHHRGKTATAAPHVCLSSKPKRKPMHLFWSFLLNSQ